MRIGAFTAKENRIVCCNLLLLVVLLTGAPALAHVEKGAMPDSVAEMEYRILLEFTPEDMTTRSLFAMALSRQNKLAEAEKEFRRILLADPKNFDALDGLGLVLFKLKRYNEALPYLSTAIKARPNDIMVHLHLGLTLACNRQPEMAREILTTGLNLLGKQSPSYTKDQQLVEFKAAMATLPNKTATPALQ